MFFSILRRDKREPFCHNSHIALRRKNSRYPGVFMPPFSIFLLIEDNYEGKSEGFLFVYR